MLTKAQANKRITEIQIEINAKWEEIETLCNEHSLIASRPDENGYKQYYVQDVAQLAKFLVYDDPEDMEQPDEDRFPGWIGSEEVGG